MIQSKLLFGLVLGSSLIAATTSCVDSSFLDETQTTDLSKEVIFSDSTYTAGFLNHLYEDAGFDVYPDRFNGGLFAPGEGGLQTACDESEFKVTSNNTDGVQFVTGTVNPVSISEKTWQTCYKQIRAANVFLANVDQSPMSESAKTRYKAEARFMRAWYYFILLRHYGGVPLLGDVVYGNDDIDNINMTRAPFADCVDYIASECRAAAAELPNRRAGYMFGHASAGSCMGLLSRLYTYVASPLYNGTTITDDPRLKPLLGYEQADKERWKDAVDASRSVMATGSWDVYIRHRNADGPEPDWGFYANFQAYDFAHLTDGANKTYEYGAFASHIFTWVRQKNQDREKIFCPISAGGNGNGGYPTHDLVMCFPMKDGAKPGEGKYTFDPMNPAANRDPRFANSIVYNGCRMRSGGTPDALISTFMGAGSTMDAIWQGTRTGYFTRKMLHRDAAGNYVNDVGQYYSLLRYEEILLNYAEAVNEYYGPDYTEQLGDQVVSPYYVLRLLRERAGIEPGADNNYGVKDGMSQDEMREAIRLERRIELAFEGHRFFDVRRWKIAEQTENAMSHGFEITRKLDGSTSYRVVNVRQHVFRPAMYFWPIPYKEVVRSEDLLQNPYYE